MILVFGKTGQVATELARLSDVVCLSRAEADLENPASCADAIHEHAPSAVINAAAYTAVDQAESDAARAMIINAAAPAPWRRPVMNGAFRLSQYPPITSLTGRAPRHGHPTRQPRRWAFMARPNDRVKLMCWL